MRLPAIRPLVYLITDGTLQPRDPGSRNAFVERLRHAAASGVDLIQIREKHLSTKELFELTRAGVQAVHEKGALLLVNGRADVAIAAGADGVHLPGDSVPAKEIRQAFPDLIIGKSAHANADVEAAKNSGADLVVFGPVFATPGKGDGVGTEGLARAAAAAPGFPVIALGGLDDSNYKEALGAGAAGFAAIRGLRYPEWVRGIERKV